jgi:hypothetical protein
MSSPSAYFRVASAVGFRIQPAPARQGAPLLDLRPVCTDWLGQLAGT